jgi:hypothetical protein
MLRLKDAFTIVKRDRSRRPSMSCKTSSSLSWNPFFRVWEGAPSLGLTSKRGVVWFPLSPPDSLNSVRQELNPGS